MKTQIKNMIFAAIAMLALTVTANAQGLQGQQYAVPAVGQPYVAPPVNQNPYYFGMHVDLIPAGWGQRLRIASVTFGSPAQQAGLEVGDEIISVNGNIFSGARDSFDAVRMLNQFVGSNFGGPAPAYAAPAVAAQAVQVTPNYSQPPIASMVVRNVRNGQNVSVTVRPILRGGVPAGPAPAAAAATVR